MATYTVTKVRGVHSAPNQLESVPDGALADSLNCVTPFKDIVQSRRGQKFYDNTFGGTGSRSNEGYFYRDTLFLHYGVGSLAYDDGSGFTDFSGFFFPTDATLLRIKFMEASKNLYWNTSVGTYVLDAIANTPRLAGVMPPLHLGSRLLVTTDAWLGINDAVAYRVVLGIKDDNNNVKLGPPSERLVFETPKASFIAAIGEMTRAASGTAGIDTVTVTHTAHNFPPYFRSNVVVTPGEVLYPTGTFAVTVTSTSAMTYLDADVANTPNIAAQTITPQSSSPQFSIVLPSGLTTDYFFRVYRSYGSGNSDVEPDDELYLVHEENLSAADITAGYISFTDRLPEAMLSTGVALYTNANTGKSITAAKEPPPLAKDILHWRNRAFYFNTTDRQRFQLNMLGVGAPNGIQNNDTLTIGLKTYTFKTSVVTPYSDVLITSVFDIAANIEETAKALMESINYFSSTTGIACRYIDKEDEPPGQLELYCIAMGAAAFPVYASRRLTWFPTLTTSSTSARTSTAERRANGFAYSDRGEPEAVPLVNFDTVGVDGSEILRAVKGRDRIFVFMDDGTIHTISGTGPFRVDPLDDTANLIGPDTAVGHNGQVLAFTTQGVVSVSESGVRILSAPIEDKLLELLGSSIDNVKLRAFAVSYESDRQYILYLPSDNAETICSQAWVYNSLFDTWMPWTGDRTWGRVRKSDNKLYLGEGAANKVRVERKDYERTDFCDEDIDVSIASFDEQSVVLVGVTDGLTVGDLLYQSDAKRALITAIDSGTRTLTVESSEDWTLGAAIVKVAIDCSVKWSPAEMGAPSVMKRFRDLNLHFKQFFTNAFNLTFDSDRAPTERTATISAPGFGLAAFGQGHFGSDDSSRNRRAGVHPDQQQANWIRVGFSAREAWSVWVLEGYSLEYEVISEKGGT
jgi:hypothetical protein